MTITSPQVDGHRIGSLFTGHGGLDEAVLQVIGGTVAWHAEYEPPSKATPRPTQAAARLLAYRHPDVPNHGDITAIDWSRVEPVTAITGGFPCTDVSLAGLGAGLRPGTRSGMWNYMATAIGVLRPRLVVIENVRGLLSAEADSAMEPCPWCVGDGSSSGLRALGAVLADLAGIGYDARWCGLRAADVGAPHGRFRVFIVAWPAAHADGVAVREQPVTECWSSGAPQPGQLGVIGGVAAHADGEGRQRPPADSGARGTAPGSPATVAGAGGCGSATPDPDGVGQVRDGATRGGRGGSPDHDLVAADTDHGADHGERARPEPRTGGEAPSDAGGVGREGRPQRHLRAEGRQPAPCGGDPAGRVLEWGAYTSAIRRWERILGRVAPAPTQAGARGGQQLSPRFVEWMQGLPEGHVTDVPGLTRNDQLKMLGNGVVPQQAAAALRFLLSDRLSEAAA